MTCKKHKWLQRNKTCHKSYIKPYAVADMQERIMYCTNMKKKKKKKKKKKSRLILYSEKVSYLSCRIFYQPKEWALNEPILWLKIASRNTIFPLIWQHIYLTIKCAVHIIIIDWTVYQYTFFIFYFHIPRPY